MTVAELIEALQEIQDQDKKVRFTTRNPINKITESVEFVMFWGG